MASDAGEGGFDGLARQYWNAWTEAFRHAAGGMENVTAAPTSNPADWRQAMEWWSQLLPRDTPPQARDAVDLMRNQAEDWFGTMQQVAAQFAGRSSTSEEVADAWKRGIQEQGDRVLQWTLGAMRGNGMPGFDPWLQQAAQGFQQWRQDTAPWLDMPTFGLGRNQQSRWQALAKAQQEYQSRWQAYADLLKSALEQAFSLFENKLAEHEQIGNQLTSARALFDLWIEAAEEGYSGVALSEEYRQVYGAFANAHMRLRAALQREVEQICEHLGMPTRSEMDSAHRRITELERALRKISRGSAQAEAHVEISEAVSAAKKKTTKSSGAGRARQQTSKTGKAKHSKVTP